MEAVDAKPVVVRTTRRRVAVAAEPTLAERWRPHSKAEFESTRSNSACVFVRLDTLHGVEVVVW